MDHLDNCLLTKRQLLDLLKKKRSDISDQIFLLEKEIYCLFCSGFGSDRTGKQPLCPYCKGTGYKEEYK